MAQVKTRDSETKKVLDQLSSGRQLTQLVNSSGTEIGTVATPLQVDIADATGITITADTEFPAAAAISDNFANPTTTSVMSMLMGFDGTAWDRISAGSGAAGTPLRVVLATDVALPIGDNNIGNVDILTIAAGDTNIGNVDLVTLPAENLGQQGSAASLSVTPATDIADPTYIGDIRFGEALPAGSNNIGDIDILTIAAGETHIGAMGGDSATPSANFTRPANTTAYASGDLVANNTTAASVVAMSFTAARVAGGSFIITRARLHKDNQTLTLANFRLHLFATSPVATAPTGGDNAAFELNSLPAGDHLGYFDFDMTVASDIQASDIELAAAPAIGNNIVVNLASGQTVFGLLEARAAYVPASGEVFTATLELLQD